VVYFKVKDAAGKVSGVVRDLITLHGPVVTRFKMNDGAGITDGHSVTLDNTCTGSAAVEYMASESLTSLTFNTANWLVYSEAPSFTLSAGNGVRKVYFKTRNGDGVESAVRRDTIVVSKPLVKYFKINNGAGSTNNQIVTLTSACKYSPVSYMASESTEFTGASWQTYSATALTTFSLSSGDTSLTAPKTPKAVYFKVKNADGLESSVKSDTIRLYEVVADTLTITGTGADTTTSCTVTLNNTFTGTAAYYMASESAKFKGAKWLPYSASPKFALSATNGTKTVYFKLKHASGQVSNVISGTITLSIPVLSSVSINAGATSTNVADVTLTPTLAAGSGTPTQYMASESLKFTTATWQTYSTSVPFHLSNAKGTKKVYFKVKNAAGQESAVKYDTIYKSAVTTTLASKAAATQSNPSTTTKVKTAVASAKVVASVATEPSTAPLVKTDVVTTQTLAKPNLQVIGYDLAETPDSAFTAMLTIANTGNAAAGAFHVALYFWTDATTSLDYAILVQEIAGDGLAAGAETTFSFVVPDLGNDTVVVCPVFIIDSQAEPAVFAATTDLFNTNTLFTVGAS